MAQNIGKNFKEVALSPLGMKVIMGGAVLFGLWWMYRSAKQTLQTTLQTDLNPNSPENVVNTYLSDIGQGITGDPNWSLDETLSRMFKSDAEKQLDTLYGPQPVETQSRGSVEAPTDSSKIW